VGEEIETLREVRGRAFSETQLATLRDTLYRSLSRSSRASRSRIRAS